MPLVGFEHKYPCTHMLISIRLGITLILYTPSVSRICSPGEKSPTDSSGTASTAAAAAKKAPRSRSANRCDLKFIRVYEEGAGGFAVRLWENDRKLRYYDCSCGEWK